MTIELSGEGYVEHRGHRVWWGAAGEGTGVPVLTVHGGPGICHDCLEPLAALADARRVVFYDQYGCGRSDRAADPLEYDVDLFVDELATLRAQLGLDQVHLFAHSYGGPIALEYVLRQPEGVVSLTLSNTFGSVPSLAAGWETRIGELSAPARTAIGAGPAADPAAFGAAMGEFVERFVLPGPPPEPLVRSQQGMGGEVYARMHGSSWFVPDGQWAGWDVLDRLGGLSMPTLVVGGERDQCVPRLAEELHAAVPGSRLEVLDAAHLPFFEVPGVYLPLVAEHLEAAER